MAKDEFFLVGQKAFITNEKGELLILIDPDRGLDLPGGKIQVGEQDLDEALKREVREETNLEIEIGKPFTRWLRFGSLSGSPEYAGKPFFILGFLCNYIAGDIILSEEHIAYHWVTKDNYQEYEGEQVYLNAVKMFFALDTDA